MATQHQFAASLKRGQQAEDYLDKWFAPDYKVRKASGAEQRRGIDRWFVRYNMEEPIPWVPVDYKADFQSWETGNAYIETVSVDDGRNPPKPGWAIAGQAKVLIYYTPQADVIYMVRMGTVRFHLKRWEKEYGPARPAMNEGYKTMGICVPLHEFETHAYEVINLADWQYAPPRPDYEGIEHV